MTLSEANLRTLPLGELVPHPDNPRLQLRDDVVDRLAAEVQRDGFGHEHAILVRPVDGGHQIVSGHHRVEAAKRAEIDAVPCWVRHMSDDEAFMQLVLSNTQGELSKIERAVHVYRYGERGEHGRGKKGGLSEYARRVDVRKQRVSEEFAVGELVENVRTSGRFSDLIECDPYSQLLETSKAPRETWRALVEALVGRGWSVADTSRRVEAVRQFGIPDQHADWLPLTHVVARYLSDEFSPRTVARLIAVTEDALAWIATNGDEQMADDFRQWLQDNRGGDSWDHRQILAYHQRLLAQRHEVAGWHHGDWRDHLDELEDGTVALLLTDPPYGMSYQSGHRTEAHEPIVGDGDDAMIALKHALVEFHPKLADDAHVVVFCTAGTEPDTRAAIEAAGYTIKSWLVWEKDNTSMGDLDGAFASKHERMVHAVKGSPKLYRRAADVVHHARVPSDRHPTEKPVPLLVELIEPLTVPGQIVADPFAGVASTCVAAKEAGRKWWGCEIEEKYWRIGEEQLS